MPGAHSCSVRSCFHNTIKDAGRSFFRFPKDRERCLVWIRNSGRTDLEKFDSDHLYRNYKICNSHFDQKWFAGLGQSKLKKNAVPTIFNSSDIDEATSQQLSCKRDSGEMSDGAHQLDWLASQGVRNVDPLQGEQADGQNLDVRIKTEPPESEENRAGFEVVTVPGCSSWSESWNALPNDNPSDEVPVQIICRLCMSSEKLIGLFDRTSVKFNLASKIMDISSIPVHEDDGLPQFICQPCVVAVQKFYDFKVQCTVTDVTLKAEHQKDILEQTMTGKKKSDVTEFEKLNVRLKANLESFHDIIDGINKLQEQARKELERLPEIGTESEISRFQKDRENKNARGKRSAAATSEISSKRSRTKGGFSASETVTSETFGLELETVLHPITSIKVEPDPDPESVVSTGIPFVDVLESSVNPKVEIDESSVFNNVSVEGDTSTDRVSLNQTVRETLGTQNENVRIVNDGEVAEDSSGVICDKNVT